MPQVLKRLFSAASPFMQEPRDRGARARPIPESSREVGRRRARRAVDQVVHPRLKALALRLVLVDTRQNPQEVGDGVDGLSRDDFSVVWCLRAQRTDLGTGVNMVGFASSPKHP